MKTSKILATFAMIAAFGVSTAFGLDLGNRKIIGTDIGTDSVPATSDVVEIAETIVLTNDFWYELDERVVILPGASIVIEPGTVIASRQPGSAEAGSLIITRGAQIFAQGTKDRPIIFTSQTDVSNWDTVTSGPLQSSIDANGCIEVTQHPTGHNPHKRGAWRRGMNEWGSIAVCGRAMIGDNRQDPNNPLGFNQLKEAPMEGLPDPLGADLNRYGGLVDGDDSGSFTYCSISYGGLDFDPTSNSELNGMSVGGVGRDFDFHHVEILNNVDDGLEIFGGTINVKCLTIWNIGDDDFDVDQGWRGCAQFILSVKGAAQQANQGSGFGDNSIEADGFDGDADGQPVTAAAIHNATVIGAPWTEDQDSPGNFFDSSDRLIALRDNCNLQIVNSIFMTDGQEAFNNDGDDGDGSTGYGAGGTLTFAERWDTPADWYYFTSNGFPNQNGQTDEEFQQAYTAQNPEHNLLQICGSLWYDINSFDVLDDTITNNVLPANAGVGSENVTLDNLVTASMPIVKVVRATPSAGDPNWDPANSEFGDPNEFVIVSTDGGLSGDGRVGNIVSLDPRATNDALDINRALVYQPEMNGFYTTPVAFRGAVGPNADWNQPWSAMAAYTNPSGNPILCSPKPTTDEPTNVELGLSACVAFEGVDGCVYEVVCIEDGNERIVKTVTAKGGVTHYVVDNVNKPLDACKKYIVRVAPIQAIVPQAPVAVQ